MTREEAAPYVDFLKGEFTIDYKVDSNNNLVIVAKKDGEQREYDPRDFLHYFAMIYFDSMDGSNDITERIELIFTAKMKVVNFVESFKNEIFNRKANNEDLSEITNRLTAATDRAKIDMDLLLLNLQNKSVEASTKLSENQIKTNII